ncbi:MAG: PEP-CTERM sorting domain-containing protein [Pseudomonadota bacterium]
MLRIFLFSALFMFGLMTLPSTFAAVVYANTITPFTGTHSDVEADIKVFDAFRLGSPATVNNVQWKGLYEGSYFSVPSVTDAFSIRFYNDINGNIGPLLGEFHVGNAVNRTSTGQIFSRNIPFYQYEANLGSGIDLLAGTQYWLSIQNNTVANADSDWFWAVEFTSANSKYLLANQYHDFPNNNHHFILSGNSKLNAISEPVTLTLFGLGLLGIATLRKRKRA